MSPGLFDDAFDALKSLIPISDEITPVGRLRELLTAGEPLFTAFFPDIDEEDEALNDEDIAAALDCPLPIFELSDSAADEALSFFEEWNQYATKSVRDEQKLQVYFWLFSY